MHQLTSERLGLPRRKPILGISRREFISLLGGAASWPLAARAQQREKRIIGVLFDGAESDRENQRAVAAFMDALRQSGWTPGRSLQVEYRWADADPNKIQGYAAELVALNPDVILATSSFGVAALRQHTTTIPIVFTRVTDPVGSGFVASLARPQGNITGFTPGEFSMFSKYPELLKEIAPEITQIAVMLILIKVLRSECGMPSKPSRRRLAYT